MCIVQVEGSLSYIASGLTRIVAAGAETEKPALANLEMSQTVTALLNLNKVAQR